MLNDISRRSAPLSYRTTALHTVWRARALGNVLHYPGPQERSISFGENDREVMTAGDDTMENDNGRQHLEATNEDQDKWRPPWETAREGHNGRTEWKATQGSSH